MPRILIPIPRIVPRLEQFPRGYEVDRFMHYNRPRHHYLTLFQYINGTTSITRESFPQKHFSTRTTAKYPRYRAGPPQLQADPSRLLIEPTTSNVSHHNESFTLNPWKFQRREQTTLKYLSLETTHSLPDCVCNITMSVLNLIFFRANRYRNLSTKQLT